MRDMPEQLGFLDSEAAGQRHVLFFALCPSDADASRIFRLGVCLRRRIGLKAQVLAAARLHVSLHGLGEFATPPKHLVDAACAAGRVVAFPPFEIAFDCAGSFRGGTNGKWPFVLRALHDVDALTLFHRALGVAMTRAGLRHGVTPYFTPHITLLYDARFVAPRAIDPVRFVVREFVLLDSLIGRGRHLRIARWPLAG
jgi:RNA 2',3'-cyclic 3'-phosphodiesterase